MRTIEVLRKQLGCGYGVLDKAAQVIEYHSYNTILYLSSQSVGMMAPPLSATGASRDIAEKFAAPSRKFSRSKLDAARIARDYDVFCSARTLLYVLYTGREKVVLEVHARFTPSFKRSLSMYLDEL